MRKDAAKLSGKYSEEYSQARFNQRNYKRFIDGDYVQNVYIISNPLNKLYKIGITDDYIRRLKDLQNASGCLLHTILVLQLGYNDEKAEYIEEYLHKYYKHKRIRGEWFQLNDSDIADIGELFWEIEGEYIHEGNYDVLMTTEDILIEAINNN